MILKYIINDKNITGNCPECGHSWDKGDVVDVMRQERPSDSAEEIIKLAMRNHGWSLDTPKRFSHLVFIEPSDGDFDSTGCNGYYQCPKCQIAWESETGERTEKYKMMLAEESAMKKFIENLKSKNK